MNEPAENNVITFVIPVLNREHFIGQCLAHITNEKNPDDKIVVVDNGSTDRTVEIANQHESVTVLSAPDATIAGLRNLGATYANGNILAFIDSDCLLCPGWRDAVVDTIARENVAAVGSTCDIPEDAGWIEQAWQSARPVSISQVHFINSANLVVRTDAFLKIDGFDENLVTDEDTDLGNRLTLAGYKLLEVPEVRVINLGITSSLREFFRTRMWHAISGLKLITAGGVDKPMVMTLAFIISWLAGFIFLPGTINRTFNPVWLIGLLLWVPFLTAMYRVYQYRNYRYFFHLVLLYLVFFVARTVMALRLLVGWVPPKKKSPSNAEKMDRTKA